MSLKTYIVNEDLRSSHSERFLTFVDRYDKHVILDARALLIKSWEKKVKALRSQYKPTKEAVVDATMKNPDAATEIKLEPRVEKIITSRASAHVDACPSVKVALVYSLVQRELMIKELLKSGAEMFKDLVEDWAEIFKYERKNKLTAGFKIVTDSDEVRLQLIVNIGSSEVYKTLYSVRVEYGKKNSKTRDFDRVYLTSLVVQ